MKNIKQKELESNEQYKIQITGNQTLDKIAIANDNSPSKNKTPKKVRPTLSPLMH
jgi:hypothetical protein